MEAIRCILHIISIPQIEGGDGSYSRIPPNLTKQKQGRVRGDQSHTENPGCIGGSV